MKIYEIGTGYTPVPARVSAATESVVEELTKAYMQMGCSVEIIDIASNDRAPNDLPITEVKVPSVFSKTDVALGLVHKLKRVVYSVCLAFRLRKILANEKERVVLHFHNQYNMFFFLKLVPKKIRSRFFLAYTNHNGMWSLPWNEVSGTLKKRYFQEIEAMKNADAVFVLNESMRRNIVGNLGLSAEKVVLIGNGVNTDVYRPLTDDEKNSIKENFGIRGKKIILQVGSVNENKGQMKVLEILTPALKKHSDLVYAFAGEIVSAEYHEKILADAVRLGVEKQVKYLGAFAPNEEMNGIYNIAHATVIASRYEGFPLVCVESLSAGVPVIVCGDMCVAVGDGCVCESDSEKISNIIYDSEKHGKLCAAARENAVKNLTWQSVAAKYYDRFGR
ncbi:MAG: glycosyltransferase family 4 protein [Clostridia bacterium]|nr:glycosyltransferase family 4 protein [Clostridia bacterium]